MTAYLAIETSCDETAAAIVADGRKILSSEIVSQIDIHQKFGGVVPEIAARKHLETVNFIVDLAMQKASIKPEDLAGIAYTAGPGLVGTLLTGMSLAKTLAWLWELPLIAVDHLQAHIFANFIDTDLEPPFIALLVSGGHTQIIHFASYTEIKIIGETRDDAAGEAYDKVARLLGLGYPGGPIIDKLAAEGNDKAFNFPEGQVSGFDFSFSGLKTAVLRQTEKLNKPWPIEDLAASFQKAVTSVLVRKTIEAANEFKATKIVLAGGVAANRELREKLLELSPCPVYFPPISLCTDNAAMVAAAAYFVSKPVGLDATVYSRS
jgi:N6-L-threonylcarbamoyladenine synthase